MKAYAKFGILATVICLSVVSISVGSDYDTTENFPTNAGFINVVGSTCDAFPVGYYTWIDLWMEKTRKGDTDRICFACGAYGRNGGHVVREGVNPSVPRGSNDVYILPICDSCNRRTFVLQADTAVIAVKLRDYLNYRKDTPDCSTKHPGIPVR